MNNRYNIINTFTDSECKAILNIRDWKYDSDLLHETVKTFIYVLKNKMALSPHTSQMKTYKHILAKYTRLQ